MRITFLVLNIYFPLRLDSLVKLVSRSPTRGALHVISLLTILPSSICSNEDARINPRGPPVCKYQKLYTQTCAFPFVHQPEHSSLNAYGNSLLNQRHTTIAPRIVTHSAPRFNKKRTKELEFTVLRATPARAYYTFEHDTKNALRSNGYIVRHVFFSRPTIHSSP